MNEFFGQFSQTINSFASLVFIINVVLHLIFASGIAKDVGNLNKRSIPTQMIAGYAWVIATAIGGILVLALYWLMHHSGLAKRFAVRSD